jgi:hypothetical protein
MLKSLLPFFLLIVCLAFSTSCETAEKTQEQTQETTNEMAASSNEIEEAAKQLSTTSTGAMTNTELKMELHNLTQAIYAKVTTIKEGINSGTSTDEATDRERVGKLATLASELEEYLVSIGRTPEDQWDNFSQKVLLKVAEAKEFLKEK